MSATNVRYVIQVRHADGVWISISSTKGIEPAYDDLQDGLNALDKAHETLSPGQSLRLVEQTVTIKVIAQYL